MSVEFRRVEGNLPWDQSRSDFFSDADLFPSLANLEVGSVFPFPSIWIEAVGNDVRVGLFWARWDINGNEAEVVASVALSHRRQGIGRNGLRELEKHVRDDAQEVGFLVGTIESSNPLRRGIANLLENEGWTYEPIHPNVTLDDVFSEQGQRTEQTATFRKQLT